MLHYVQYRTSFFPSSCEIPAVSPCTTVLKYAIKVILLKYAHGLPVRDFIRVLSKRYQLYEHPLDCLLNSTAF